jgi:hypothetical protein
MKSRGEDEPCAFLFLITNILLLEEVEVRQLRILPKN